MCRCSVCNCGCSSLYPPSEFLQSSGQWCNVNIIFMYPQKKKSGQVKSWDWCGQVPVCICQFISLERSGRDILTAIWKSGGAPSCQIGVSLGPRFTKIGMINFSGVCMYVRYTIHSVFEKKGPRIFLFGHSTKDIELCSYSVHAVCCPPRF
jgi:hypothetical protein